jgi:Fe-S-cluster containining protein
MPSSTSQRPVSLRNGDQPCRRCGTCCRKGGPALHRQDAHLVDDGFIPAEALYTIRAGEPVQDNVAGRPAFAGDDIIKIKGRADSWCCRFLEDATNCCTIYDHRPLECRVLQCWDTRAIEGLYDWDRLSRRDLLQGVTGLWDLVEDHERRCGYHRLRDLAGRLSEGPSDQKAALGAVTDMVKYDESLRQLLVENGHTPAGMLDFLLGRPLVQTLPGFHIQVESSGGRIRLVHSILT